MSYLLDTNVVYRLRIEPEKLPPKIQTLLEDASEQILYSVITPWELSIKSATKKLSLPKDFFHSLPTIGFGFLSIEETHVDSLRKLPALHRDPFDRMLLAQAKAERLTLITADKKLADYPVKVLLV